MIEPVLIGISGKIASGKDTLAAYLINAFGGVRVAFADELKTVAAHLFGVNPAHKDNRTRTTLQDFGVACRRIDPEVWVNLALRTARERVQTASAPYVYVTDVRFPNEAQAIINHGGYLLRLEVDEAIRLDRIRTLYPTMDPSRMQHESETALDDYPRFAAWISSDDPAIMCVAANRFMWQTLQESPKIFSIIPVDTTAGMR